VRARAAELLRDSGALALLLRAKRRLPPRTVAVVTYHHVLDPGDDYRFDPDLADVTPAQFRRHVEMLAAHFSIIDLATLAAGLDGGGLPPNPCVITFDDGYRSNLTEAVPILRAAGATATFFIATGYTTQRRLYWWDRIAYLVASTTRPRLELDYPNATTIELGDRTAARRTLTAIVKNTPGLDLERFLRAVTTACSVPWDAARERALADELIMTWDEVRQLAAAGMTVASHTRDHRVLETMEPAALADDLTAARTDLARELGSPTTALAYPVGRSIAHHRHVRAAVAAAGYRMGFTNASGVIDLRRRRHLDRLDLARLAVDRDLPDALFLAQVAIPAFAYTRSRS
jgi:peptidoglycan/xylan/chitin deacetylase (PgdA/CDA1 family)